MFHRMLPPYRFLLIAAAISVPTLAYGQLSVLTYGAKCNWNGSSGTDDTTAFLGAAKAANTLYNATEAVVSVQLPAGQACVVDGLVTVGSGVHFVGPGTIIVQNQSGATL